MALALGVRPHESVLLTLPDGSEIRVGVSEVRSNQARLYFEADASIDIARCDHFGRPVGKKPQRAAC